MNQCPECNSDDIEHVDGGFDRDRMISWSEYRCEKCACEWLETEDVDDNQLEYDNLGMFSYVRPKTRPEDV